MRIWSALLRIWSKVYLPFAWNLSFVIQLLGACHCSFFMLTSCLEVNIDVDISCMVDFSYLLCFNLHVFCSSVWACTWAQEVLRVVAEGKIPQDEPAILLSATRDDKRKAHFFTPLGKRIDSRLDRERSLEKDRDCERERDRDSELMPPPGSHRKKSLPPPTDIDQPIDPDEPTYCICGQVTPAQWIGLYWSIARMGLTSHVQFIWEPTSFSLHLHLWFINQSKKTKAF